MLRVKGMKLLNKKECSFELGAGEWLQIIGPNGVGKSLLLKSIARLIPAEWQELSLNEKGSKDYVIEDWRSQLMYIPPEVVFDQDATVEDFFNEPFQFVKYKNFLKTFEPREHWSELGTSMSVLSSGQKQQVALLRALSLNPKILLLDEPFGHMDAASRERFIQFLSDWSTEDRALILVSHIELPGQSGRIRRLAIGTK